MLERINSPADLKSLTYPQLNELAVEIRDMLVRTVSENGGHLASSLGTVELTLALHRVFNSPEDKIIWDVGHQAYPHKLITGRREQFGTLRQYGGLAGFPERGESPHDPFSAGHSGTSISAALGMALARDMNHEKFHVIAVIGDGSLGAGIAFEAINHAGHLGTRLIVLLNDNGMSISPSIGGLSRFLNQVRFDPKYESTKRGAHRTITRLPFGNTAWQISKRIKSGVESVILPSAFWEQLGFTYLGPVDGHNTRELEAALSRARDFETKPVVVHALTQKGKGYPAAEKDATRFHGVSPNRSPKSGAPSYSQVFGDTILQLMERDEKIVAVTAAMLDGTGLVKAAAKFPRRVFDVGICEQHAVTFAAGLAAQGLKPVVAIYSTFLQRAYDQLIHDVCMQKLPVVFAIDRAGIVGDDGKTHQGAFDISFLRAVPNMIIAAPKDEDEFRHLLYSAVCHGAPAAVRYPRGSGQGVAMSPELQLISPGKGEIIRQGSDLAILGIGPSVYAALTAAGQLSDVGIECAVANARFAKPVDKELITELAHTRRLVTVEENALAGGFGSSVMETLQASGLNDVKVELIGLPDVFIEHGSQELFRARFELDAQGIARRVMATFPGLVAHAAKR